MKYINVLYLILTLFFSCAIAPNAMAQTKVAQSNIVQLKQNPIISGQTIKVGDIFENTGSMGSQILARAPQNGNGMVFSASVLQSRIASFGLRWPNTEGLRQVIINGRNTPNNISSTTPGIGSRPTQNLGVAQNQTSREVAVLNRNVSRGEIINDSMVSWLNTNEALTNDTIINAEDLIGKSAKQNILAQVPVRNAQLGPALMVRRGQIITLVHEAGGMRITMRGRSLSDGIAGSNIRVVNTTSNRTIEAMVESDGVARVLLPTSAASISASIN